MRSFNFLLNTLDSPLRTGDVCGELEELICYGRPKSSYCSLSEEPWGLTSNPSTTDISMAK